MKRFKIAFALLGILCGFTLNGCINDGAGSSGTSSNVGSTNTETKLPLKPGTIGNLLTDSNSTNGSDALNNSDNLNNSPKETHPILTSFALWANKDDAIQYLPEKLSGTILKCKCHLKLI